jgi:CRISPR-associated protein Cmx8
MMGVDSMEDKVTADSQSKSLEAIVFGLVKTYVLQKLDRKHQLKWKDVEGNSGKEEDYRKYKEKVARSAFLDVRSRTEKTDFINYFVSSLCSVPHRLSMADYSSLTQALYEDTEKVRTLTLLALSANS